MEMGDDCECGAPREVMITSYAHGVIFVTKRVHHQPGCFLTFDREMQETPIVEETDIMSWEFNGRKATFGWVEYPVLGRHVNGVPCVRCWRLADMPITLFLEGGKKGELTFCGSCVEKYKMLQGFVQGGTYANFKTPNLK